MSPVPAPEPVDPGGGGLVLVGIPDEGDSVVFTGGQWEPGAGGGGGGLPTTAPYAFEDDGVSATETITAIAGQTASLLDLKDETGATFLFVKSGAPGAAVQCVLGDELGPYVQLLAEAAQDRAFIDLYGGANADVSIEVDATKASVTITPEAGQTAPLLNLLGGYQQFSNMTDPAAPADNAARVYVRDNGGKDELVARFASGAIQQIAIEP